MCLNVLKLGVSINLVEDIFPNFKDVQLGIAINLSVIPVCQPYRRVPITLENKIKDKLDGTIVFGTDVNGHNARLMSYKFKTKTGRESNSGLLRWRHHENRHSIHSEGRH